MKKLLQNSWRTLLSAAWHFDYSSGWQWTHLEMRDLVRKNYLANQIKKMSEESAI